MPPYPNLFGTPLAKYVPNFMLLSQNAQLFWLSDCYIKMHNCFGYLLYICCIVIVILKNGCRGCHVENSGCLHIQIYSGCLWLQMYQISSLAIALQVSPFHVALFRHRQHTEIWALARLPNIMLLSQNTQLSWLSDCCIKMHNCFVELCSHIHVLFIVLCETTKLL